MLIKNRMLTISRPAVESSEIPWLKIAKIIKITKPLMLPEFSPLSREKEGKANSTEVREYYRFPQKI